MKYMNENELFKGLWHWQSGEKAVGRCNLRWMSEQAQAQKQLSRMRKSWQDWDEGAEQQARKQVRNARQTERFREESRLDMFNPGSSDPTSIDDGPQQSMFTGQRSRGRRSSKTSDREWDEIRVSRKYIHFMKQRLLMGYTYVCAMATAITAIYSPWHFLWEIRSRRQICKVGRERESVLIRPFLRNLLVQDRAKEAAKRVEERNSRAGRRQQIFKVFNPTYHLLLCLLIRPAYVPNISFRAQLELRHGGISFSSIKRI